MSKFNETDARKILDNLQNKTLIKNSLNTIKKLSLKNWGNEYLKLLWVTTKEWLESFIKSIGLHTLWMGNKKNIQGL